MISTSSTQVLHTAIPPCRGLFINHAPVNCQLVSFDASPWVHHMRRRIEEQHNTQLRSLSEVIYEMMEASRGEYSQQSCATFTRALIPDKRAYVKCEVNEGIVAVILDDVTPFPVHHNSVTWALADDGVTERDLLRGSTDFAATFDATYALYPSSGDPLPVRAYVTAKVLGETEGSFLLPIEYIWIDLEEDNISEHCYQFRTSYSLNHLRDMVPVVEIDPPAYIIVDSDRD